MMFRYSFLFSVNDWIKCMRVFVITINNWFYESQNVYYNHDCSGVIYFILTFLGILEYFNITIIRDWFTFWSIAVSVSQIKK